MRLSVRAASVLALALTAAVTTVSNVAGAAPSTGRSIVYDGARIAVPASWPVYNLDKNPTQCVRFDVHAVYLGHPGANQNCPAHLVGRTTAMLVEPYDSKAQVAAPDPDAGATQTVTSNGRALITASYGAAGPQSAASVIRPTAVRAGTPAAKSATVKPAATTGPKISTGYGFDTCTAPDAPSMLAWKAPASAFKSVGIYIGGINRACPDGNLSTSWINTVRGYGYTFIPTYVGRQAPCSKVGTKISTNPTQATTNGHDAAVNAIHLMQHFGFGAHTPVYLDLEQYDTGNAVCTRSVQRFLDAWVKRLHPSGYLGGVYISGTDTPDLMSARKIKGFHLPDAVWIVRWNNRVSVYGDPTIPNNYWAPHKRVHQIRGPHDAKHGDVTLNIDTDYLDGPVA